MASTPTDMQTEDNAANRRLALLQSAPMDSWIALSEDESVIVASGATYEEVVRNSEKAGVSDPLLIKTPRAWHSIAV